MRALWRGAISFGLVSIPVRVFGATEEHGFRFHQVHRVDGGQVRHRRVCSVCDEEVPAEEMANGYRLEDGRLVVIEPEDFANAALLARRQRDHERIDTILAGRVSAEDAELSAASTVTTLDRVLRPLNQAGSKRFLREARQKVWHNTRELHDARLDGPEEYAARLAELEVLSAAKVADLLAPGQVVLKLTVAGFGVTLPPPA